MRNAFSARRQGWRRLASLGAAVLGVLGGALITIASVQAVTDAASADPTSLGTTPAVFGYSEFSGGDSSLGSPSGTSIAGTAVVGGDLNVPNGGTLTLGTSEAGSNVLDVAGNVTGTGTLCVGGSNNYAKYLGTSSVQSGPGCGNLQQSSKLAPSAFQAIAAYNQTISNGWASMSSNGTEQLSSGNLTLTGTASALQVFTVPASDFAVAQTLTIDVPPATTQVLINVVQTAPGPLGTGTLPLTTIVYPGGSTIAPNTWVNFPDASSVTFSGLDMNANVLAPNGVVTMDGGQFDGYVYAASLDGSFTAQLPSHKHDPRSAAELFVHHYDDHAVFDDNDHAVFDDHDHHAVFDDHDDHAVFDYDHHAVFDHDHHAVFHDHDHAVLDDHAVFDYDHHAVFDHDHHAVFHDHHAVFDHDDHAVVHHDDHAVFDHDDHAVFDHDHHAVVHHDDHAVVHHDDHAVVDHDHHAVFDHDHAVFHDHDHAVLDDHDHAVFDHDHAVFDHDHHAVFDDEHHAVFDHEHHAVFDDEHHSAPNDVFHHPDDTSHDDHHGLVTH